MKSYELLYELKNKNKTKNNRKIGRKRFSEDIEYVKKNKKEL